MDLSAVLSTTHSLFVLPPCRAWDGPRSLAGLTARSASRCPGVVLGVRRVVAFPTDFGEGGAGVPRMGRIDTRSDEPEGTQVHCSGAGWLRLSVSGEARSLLPPRGGEEMRQDRLRTFDGKKPDSINPLSAADEVEDTWLLAAGLAGRAGGTVGDGLPGQPVPRPPADLLRRSADGDDPLGGRPAPSGVADVLRRSSIDRTALRTGPFAQGRVTSTLGRWAGVRPGVDTRAGRGVAGGAAAAE